MVFTARIRRSVVMPIDEPIAGCSPTKYRWSKERIETLALDDVASDYSKATQDQGYRLPVEVLAIVAEYLVLNSSYKTCAALNQTCHAVQQQTAATLWRTLSAWNPPRYAHTDSAEDEMQLQEINERWWELFEAPGIKYTEFILIPPFALDLSTREIFLRDDYSLNPHARSIFPRLKAFVYFEEFIAGPRLILAQPHLRLCKGYVPCAGDLEGLLRLVASAPEVRGTTMIRPPWTIRVPERTTSIHLHGKGREFRLFDSDGGLVTGRDEAYSDSAAETDLDEEAEVSDTLDEDPAESETETTDEYPPIGSSAGYPSSNDLTDFMDQDRLEDEADASESSVRARRRRRNDCSDDETGPRFSDQDAFRTCSPAGLFDTDEQNHLEDEADAGGYSEPARRLNWCDSVDDEIGKRFSDLDAFRADSLAGFYETDEETPDVDADEQDGAMAEHGSDSLDAKDEEQDPETGNPQQTSFDSVSDRRPNAEPPAGLPVERTEEEYALQLAASCALPDDDSDTKESNRRYARRLAKLRYGGPCANAEEFARALEADSDDVDATRRVLEPINDNTSGMTSARDILGAVVKRGLKRKDPASDSEDEIEALDAAMEEQDDTSDAQAYESDAFSAALMRFIAKHCKVPALDEDGEVEPFTEEEVEAMHDGILEWLADQSQILDQDATEDENDRFLRIVRRYMEWMNDQDVQVLDTYIADQYAPLDLNDFAKGVSTGLSETFPYPLTVVEFSPTYIDRHENRVASIFVEVLRLAMSLPQNKMTKRLSFRNLLANEVIACIESYQPLIVLHPEFASLKLEFQILDVGLEDQTPFEDCVERVFSDIRDGLFAISCRGTPLENMGTFDITREVDEQVEEKWYLRVLPQQKSIGWGISPKEPFAVSQDFPEDVDAYVWLRDQYARSMH